MERLDDLSLGILGQTSGEDKDHPPIASSAAIDHTALSVDAPQTSFNAPHQTLVHLGPAVRREQDPSTSESVSWEILPGAPLCAMLPTSALRHRPDAMQLDAEPDFAADFYLPSPVASSQPLRLPNGRWELGTSIQTAMVKSSVNGDPLVRAGHLCFIQSLALGG